MKNSNNFTHAHTPSGFCHPITDKDSSSGPMRCLQICDTKTQPGHTGVAWSLEMRHEPAFVYCDGSLRMGNFPVSGSYFSSLIGKKNQTKWVIFRKEKQAPLNPYLKPTVCRHQQEVFNENL